MANPERRCIPGLTTPSEPSAYEPLTPIAVGRRSFLERRGQDDEDPDFYLYHAGSTPYGAIVVRVLDGTTTQPVLHPPHLMDDFGTIGWSTWQNWCEPTDKDRQDAEWLLGIAKVIEVEPQPILLTDDRDYPDVVLNAGLNSFGWPFVRVFWRKRRVLAGIDLGARLLKWCPGWKDFTGDPAPILAEAETAEWDRPPSTEIPPLPTYPPKGLWPFRASDHPEFPELFRKDRDSR